MDNRWKLTGIAAALVATTALITGLVVAGRGGREIDRRAEFPSASPRPTNGGTAPLPDASPMFPAPSAAPAVPAAPLAVPDAAPAAPAPPAPPKASVPARRVAAVPPSSVVTTCNNEAQVATKGEPSRTKEALKDGAIGGLGGAAVGALGGAIVKGGSGAGKGAAIGGLLGAGGGALYGLNKAKENDAAYKAAYARCMKGRGYTV
jgi:hypothetical protein